jgi:hypothetical protein
MKKAVWIAFGAAIVGVNAAAEAVEFFTDTELVAYFRVMLIMGVLFITMVFLGAYALVSAAEEEKPLAGSVHNTLGADKTAAAAKKIPPQSQDAGTGRDPLEPDK